MLVVLASTGASIMPDISHRRFDDTVSCCDPGIQIDRIIQMRALVFNKTGFDCSTIRLVRSPIRSPPSRYFPSEFVDDTSLDESSQTTWESQAGSVLSSSLV